MAAYFGGCAAAAQLRFTSKVDATAALLALEHNHRNRTRASLNPPAYARLEDGTSPVAARIAALRRIADASYKIGLTIAPIIAADGWRAAYAGSIAEVTVALHGVTGLDLKVELITPRYTAGSKVVLDSWYPLGSRHRFRSQC